MLRNIATAYDSGVVYARCTRPNVDVPRLPFDCRNVSRLGGATTTFADDDGNDAW
jgi:hypothetical protein